MERKDLQCYKLVDLLVYWCSKSCLSGQFDSDFVSKLYFANPTKLAKTKRTFIDCVL